MTLRYFIIYIHNKKRKVRQAPADQTYNKIVEHKKREKACALYAFRGYLHINAIYFKIQR